MTPKPMARSNWIRAPHFFNLDMACRSLVDAFGVCIYLVGSSIERRDFGDVDVRAIMRDEEYERLMPSTDEGLRRARLILLNASISLWLSKRSDLPVDFQIQRQTIANEDFNGPRQALGIAR